MPFVFLRLLTVSLWIDFLATNTNAIRATVQLCDHKHERPPENVSKMTVADSDYMLDLVRKQYMNLPYPYVSAENIQMEHEYYQGQQRNIPLLNYYSGALEFINHYLYRGQNSFE